MKYFFAILLPPLTVLFCVGFCQAILNFILCLFGWLPGVLHAIIMIRKKERERSEALLLKVLVAGQMTQAAQMQQIIINQSKLPK